MGESSTAAKRKPRSKPSPKGAAGKRPRVVVLIGELQTPDVEALMAKVDRAAGRDDMAAAKGILDRVLTPRKGGVAVMPIPAIRSTRDVRAALAPVDAAIATRHLSGDEGFLVASIIATTRHETTDMKRADGAGLMATVLRN